MPPSDNNESQKEQKTSVTSSTLDTDTVARMITAFRRMRGTIPTTMPLLTLDVMQCNEPFALLNVRVIAALLHFAGQVDQCSASELVRAKATAKHSAV